MFRIITFILFWGMSINAVQAETFYFTSIPDQNKERLVKRFDNVARYFSEKLGVNVEYVPVSSYEESVEAFVTNKVQLAWFGGLSGVRARFKARGAIAFAQGGSDMNFQTYFIAHKSSNLQRSDTFPKEIVGKSFTFGSEQSTSGRLMPEYYIRKYLNKAPKDVFSKVNFSENHTRTVELVQNGKYQVGAVNYLIWKEMLAAGEIDTNEVNVIWKTPIYPDYHWTLHSKVDEVWGVGFTNKLVDVILNLEEPEIMQALGRKHFVSTSNLEYLPILETAIKLDLLY